MVGLSELRENVERAQEAIAGACRRVGRDRDEVRLMAVTKTHPASAIGAAAELGIRLFGENKVQEFAAKQSLVTQFPDAEKIGVHLIGHLQSNKAAKAAEIFDGVDTIDSLKLAERLESAAASLAKPISVLVEIKLSAEESKSGLAPESAELETLLERLPDLRHLRMQGLMTVPPYLRDSEAVRPYFQRLRQLRDGWAPRYPKLGFEILSMGMSHDFEAAIEEGSTEVRLGTALFGPRARKGE
jgi:pyridoxal phosphate enzyme (YggS family)